MQGDIDTALDFDEFVEALLRIALTAWQDDQSVRAPWQKMRRVAALVAGELEAEATKLNFERLLELIVAEVAKLNELRLELIYEQFAPDTGDSLRADEIREIKKRCENNPKQEDLNFRAALKVLEAEGDEEAARARRAALDKVKKAKKGFLNLKKRA